MDHWPPRAEYKYIEIRRVRRVSGSQLCMMIAETIIPSASSFTFFDCLALLECARGSRSCQDDPDKASRSLSAVFEDLRHGPPCIANSALNASG